VSGRDAEVTAMQGCGRLLKLTCGQWVGNDWNWCKACVQCSSIFGCLSVGRVEAWGYWWWCIPILAATHSLLLMLRRRTDIK